MKKSSGFTLIELVVVIVILGILAATAAPKFMDLQKDARISALNGLMGAMKSANSMVYSKAILAGQDTVASGFVCSNGDSCDEKKCPEGKSSCEEDDKVYPASRVTLRYGHPAADKDGIVKALQDDIVEYSATEVGDWVYLQKHQWIRIYPAVFKDSTNTTECYVQYTAPDSKDKNPEFKLVKTGC